MQRALLIGINYFGQDAELQGCINDVHRMKDYLSTRGFTEFVLLTDSKDDPKWKLSTAPTQENIIKCMRNMIEKTLSNDTLFVHFSGHGSQLRDDNGDELDGLDECICPVDFSNRKRDAGFIRDDRLYDILVKGLKEGARLRVVFDCCHSGSGIDLPLRWVSGGGLVSENKHPMKGNIVFISGCRDAQTSADASFAGTNAGALTYTLLKALNVINNDKTRGSSRPAVYTWRDLGEMIRLRLKKDGYDQIPQICFAEDKLNMRVDL